MNQPVATKTYTLPPMGHPAVTRVVTLCPLDELKVNELTWVLNQAHPIIKSMRIVRMFDGDAGVEVYSVDGDGTPMRNRIPSMMIKLVEEAMPIEVFIEEIARAESDDDDDDGNDDEDDEGGTETDTGPSAPFSGSAGSAVSS